MDNFSFLHYSNIVMHVTAGLIALISGLIILLVQKGGKAHRKIGRTFLVLLAIVVITGLFGVLIFGRNTFLLVITVSSGYTGYSGFRAVRTKSNKPKSIDIFAALLGLGSALYFLYYIKSIGMIWSPIIIYATVGFLFLVIAYDLLRYLIPEKKYKNLWFYEHIYKMIGAFTALLAAAVGTMFPDYKPYSQFLPSVFGTFLAMGFIVYFYRKRKHLKKEWLPSKKS